ncbi:redox-sensing transcriptional repressor Rex [Clostridium estertheticum]|uniref:Redox-sensing transcriptional repressor Rex n=1 Tax=Clostridium estertheticum TaxID=238834 RepID=A0A5N7IM32_9CLOT|nr:redox-sensing transcriptional repressor Rex [Clostridium estertheticum]MBU3072409.1 redox-sensing transcriptional repressor Rex [Clostridium estertheticum]MBU3162502.1 redox-sensing transcriptional repressor Rex [Clostridium estertheticum]MPQ31379.1 redox-sensing transcriptional repressor Rex [Clostridium estertheticum]MPQ62052.1 redox-sensing transcriptional repressor Rex [Clostridium estertheticum]
MENQKNIPMLVIRRMTKYHTYLNKLVLNNVVTISSRKFGEIIGFTSSQIRRDLNYFGDFGTQRIGYNVKELLIEINGILGLFKKHNMIIIGANNIGKATVNYTRYKQLNLKLVGIFDVNPELIGLTIQNIKVLHINKLVSFLKTIPTDIGVICVSKNYAQKVTDIMVENGVKCICNITPVDLKVPKDIILENVNLTDSLLTLSCLMNASI